MKCFDCYLFQLLHPILPQEGKQHKNQKSFVKLKLRDLFYRIDFKFPTYLKVQVTNDAKSTDAPPDAGFWTLPITNWMALLLFNQDRK